MPLIDLTLEHGQTLADIVGSAEVFLAACGAIVIWAVFGPWYNFSDTWQLVINTATTIVTSLMVFMIQATFWRSKGSGDHCGR